MDKQRGRPVLLEFFDVCRPASLRTLPYLQAWHERYEADGLRVICVHAPGFAPGRDEDVVAGGGARGWASSIRCCSTPTCCCGGIYENRGWPARYLFDRELRLFEVHFGEGGYRETEAAIQELLGVEREPVPSCTPRTTPRRGSSCRRDDQAGPWSGPYEAGAVWAVLEGEGEIVVNGERRRVDYPARTCSSTTAATSTGCSSSRSATASPATPSASRRGWPRSLRRPELRPAGAAAAARASPSSTTIAPPGQ